jgi:hypothetical protein
VGMWRRGIYCTLRRTGNLAFDGSCVYQCLNLTRHCVPLYSYLVYVAFCNADVVWPISVLGHE